MWSDLLTWEIKLTPKAHKELSKIDRQDAARIIRFLHERVAENPTSIGSPLKGQLRQFWRWRIGNYRILGKIEQAHLLVLVVKIGNRRDVYS